MSRNPWFTLIEVLLSVLLTGIILGAGYSSFQSILRAQIRLSGIISIQKNIFYLNEKIASLIDAGGTIDYEEYFNRRVLGDLKSFTAEGVWTYTVQSHYGNGDNTGWCPKLYLCGKDTSVNQDACLGTNSVALDLRAQDLSCIRANTLPILTGINLTSTLDRKQMMYGQYREVGLNYASASKFASPIKLPPIFPENDIVKNTQGTSDLYLIKKLPDASYERTYFRHVYQTDPLSSWVCNPATGLEHCIGKIQMTRLTSCDSLLGGGDGVIDAWARHPDFGGTAEPCSGIDNASEIMAAATGLMWVDVNSPDMNILEANFLPSPVKHPLYMSGVGELALSPKIRMRLVVDLSQKKKSLLKDIGNTERTLVTTIDLENY